jgi:hypothetical protein
LINRKRGTLLPKGLRSAADDATRKPQKPGFAVLMKEVVINLLSK